MTNSLSFDISPQYPLPNYGGVGAPGVQPFAGNYGGNPTSISTLAPLAQDTFGAKYYGRNEGGSIPWKTVLAGALVGGLALFGGKLAVTKVFRGLKSLVTPTGWKSFGRKWNLSKQKTNLRNVRSELADAKSLKSVNDRIAKAQAQLADIKK